MDDHRIHTIVPRLRFPDFLNDGEWEVKRLGDIAEKVTSKNKSNEQLPVLTNSATEGVVNQQDYFDREIVTRENLTNYHIIELNDFVYNPRISVAAPVGPISRNKIGIGIMSPLYTIFKFKEGNIDFFEQYFRTNCWHQYLKDKANFGARFDRMNISNEDFFNLPIPFPPLVEQRRIAACLSALDEMLAATNGKLEQLKAYKKGLMQKLFPAKGKKLPELRFKEFEKDGEWEEKKLGEIISVNSGRDYKHLNYGNIPVYGTGGYMLSVDDKLSDIDAVGIGRKGTIDKPQYLKAPFWTVDTLFFLTSLNGYDIQFIYYLTQTVPWKKYGEQTGVPSLSKLSIENLNVVVPPSAFEQRKIVQILLPLDEELESLSQKIVLLENQKKGLMQQLFVY